MSWLDRWDTKAAKWPIPGKAAYFGLRWYFIGLGAFILIRLYLDRTGLFSLY